MLRISLTSLLSWIKDLFVIEENHLGAYMRRYWLFRPRDRTKMQIRFHRILRSDKGRHLHDHPWPYVSIILKGGYYELTPLSSALYRNDTEVEFMTIYNPYTEKNEYCTFCKKWYKPGSILFRKATHKHRILIPENEAWTLFITGKKIREWGFDVGGRWVYHQEYKYDYNLDPNDHTKEFEGDRNG